MKTKQLPYKILILFAVTIISTLVTSCQAPMMVSSYKTIRTPVRGFLHPHEKPPTGYSGYGYVIFTRRLDIDDSDRWVKTCQSYIRSIEPISVYSSLPSKSLSPTYWYGTNELNKSSSDCKHLVAEYDYARAKTILSAISSSRHPYLASTGPLLVAWSKPFEDTNSDEKALVIDLSGFSDGEFDRIFGIWIYRISMDPRIWQSGLDLSLVKEAFRDVLLTRADDFIKAIEKWPPL